MSHQKNLGEANGWVLLLFKLELVILPPLLTAILVVSGFALKTMTDNQRAIAVLQERVRNIGNSLD